MAAHTNILRTLQTFEQPLPPRLLSMLEVENSRDMSQVGYVTESLAEFTSGHVFADANADACEANQTDYERQIALLVVQLCSALSHLHRHGVVHRNVGLSSILVGPMSDSWYVV